LVFGLLKNKTKAKTNLAAMTLKKGEETA